MKTMANKQSIKESCLKNKRRKSSSLHLKKERGGDNYVLRLITRNCSLISNQH